MCSSLINQTILGLSCSHMSFLIDPASWVFTIFISRCPFGEAVYSTHRFGEGEKRASFPWGTKPWGAGEQSFFFWAEFYMLLDFELIPSITKDWRFGHHWDSLKTQVFFLTGLKLHTSLTINFLTIILANHYLYICKCSLISMCAKYTIIRALMYWWKKVFFLWRVTNI
jgi:hypothetical protein